MPRSVATHDPRASRAYLTKRKLWLTGFGGAIVPCALCGQPLDTALPPGRPGSPTVEHRVKVSTLRRMARDWAHLVALVCDTSMWASTPAHRRCQSRQGQRVTTAILRNRDPRRAPVLGGASREW